MGATLTASGAGTAAPVILDRPVRRPRLEDLLADGARRRVTLVCAPPGSGKTTLLASWFTDLAPGRARWLTAGGDDDEVVRQVLDEAVARRQVVVVDDAHHLAGAALAAVERVVEALPDGVDVVLAARADPRIRLSHLRLRASIREIRGALLAFTAEEAAELLCRDGVRLRSADVVRLHACTEGWAAGLRLVQCALDRGASPASLAEDETATQAVVSDYLLSEVLERERVRLEGGDATGALAVLDRHPPATPRESLESLLLRARATAGTDPTDARHAVAAAVQLAASLGFLRTVTDEAALHGEYRALYRSAPSLAIARVTRELDRGTGHEPLRPALAERLTSRELDVLRLLPSHLSVPAIAVELGISANTARTHVKHLYRKLGVESRSAAVDHARLLGLH